MSKIVVGVLEGRIKQLSRIKMNLEHSVTIDLPGRLRVSKCGKQMRHYYCSEPGDKQGKYLGKREVELAQALAQKDYEQKALRAVERELKCIERFLAEWQKDSIEDVYEKLHPERQKLVVPAIETEAQFIEAWEAVEFQGKGFRDGAPELYTARGERVRSKSEMIIADLLAKEGVPYRYEYPLELEGFGTVYPDFTVLDVIRRREIYWEHLGMMDDTEYAENAVKKIDAYKRNGYFPGDNLIITQETRMFPIDQRSIVREIRQYLL